MTGMLAPLSVLVVAKVERQAFAVVPLIEYETLEDWREPSLFWVTRARGATAPPLAAAMFAYLLALSAVRGSRALRFGGRS